jgi:ABC-type transporter Mla MlaB component
MTGQQRPTITLPIHGPILPDDLAGLCARVCRVLEAGDGAVVVCDVDGVGADATTVDALARLQLAARRHGCRLRMRRASPDLQQLVAFMGLQDVLAS